MTDNDAFIASIREHPDDDVRRLIYADWLEEHDEAAKGEYLRIVHALMTLPEEDSKREGLISRLLVISESVEAEWREAVGRRFDLVLEGWLANAATNVIRGLRTLAGFTLGVGQGVAHAQPRPLRLQTNRLREELEAFLNSINVNRFDLESPKSNMFRIVPTPLSPSALADASSE